MCRGRKRAVVIRHIELMIRMVRTTSGFTPRIFVAV
jgi:hypothetical protein